MPRLTFKKSQINTLIAAAKKHRNAINLVGDQGVYFATPLAMNSPPLCVYATNCEPATCADWREVKQRTFGQEDGVEPVRVATLEAWARQTAGDTLVLQINAVSVAHVTDAKAAGAAPRSSPDVFEVKNDDRAARAQAALKFYAENKGERLHTSPAQISDLIADLLHLAAYQGHGPKTVNGIVSLARLNHPAEDDQPIAQRAG